jgi:hypothetical protein
VTTDRRDVLVTIEVQIAMRFSGSVVGRGESLTATGTLSYMFEWIERPSTWPVWYARAFSINATLLEELIPSIEEGA